MKTITKLWIHYFKMIVWIAVIFYLAFLQSVFSFWQVVAVLIVTSIVLSIIEEVINLVSKDKLPGGFKWRIAVSIYGSIAWLIFVIAYLAFIPTGFNVWQNISVVAISILVLGGIMAGIWVPWKVEYWQDVEKYFERFEEMDTKSKRK